MVNYFGELPVLLGIFAGLFFFSYSLTWTKFLCLLNLLNFLQLYEVRWKSYLYQSCRGVLVWTCPCAVCSLCAWRLWDRVGAEVAKVMPFPGCIGSWQFGGRLRGRLDPGPSVSRGFSCALWLSISHWTRRVPRRWSRSPDDGLNWFHLVSVHPPPTLWHLCPRGWQRWSEVCWSSPWCGWLCLWCRSGTPSESLGPSLMAALPHTDILLVSAGSVPLTAHSAQHGWPLAPGGGWTGSRGAEGASVGQGTHRLPSKPAESWKESCHPLGLFQEQERVRVSGEESGSWASCGSPWVHSSCRAVTSWGCPRAAVPSAWCSWVSPGRTSEPLFLSSWGTELSVLLPTRSSSPGQCVTLTVH